MPRIGETSTQRGYGSGHQRERARWVPKVATGTVDCRRCHQPILTGQEWDLGHQEDRTAPTHPEHRYRRDCPAGGNRSTGGRPGYTRAPEPHPGLRR